jgi:hypothetical protein
MVKKIFGVLVVMLATGAVFGQKAFYSVQANDAILNSTVPPSPNASSLGKYGDYQTDLFTGLPSISIPLMTVKSQDLSVPVSISYHASGIKVDEIASWVGLGWSLNAGGVITRTVRGGPDDDPALGYWANGQTYINGLGGSNKSTYLLSAYKNHYDLQPDEYYYNIGSSSGKFLVFWDMSCHPVPYSNIKIEFVSATVGDTGTFKITDGNGTSYFFNDLETTDIISPGGDEQIFTSSWYMSKIVSAQHDAAITFNYTEFDHTVPMQLQYTSYQLSNSCTMCSSSYEVNATSSPAYQGKRLASITWADGKVVFTPQAAPRQDLAQDNALDNIQSFNADNNPISQFKFDYSYGSNRLMLKTITEISNQGTSKPPYVFTYDATNLPERFSHGIDHWGYANGAPGNQNLIPLQSDAGFFPNGGNREPLLSATRAQTLLGIGYPTGGNTRFEYESNFYGYDQTGALINDSYTVQLPKTDQKRITLNTKGTNVDDNFQFTIDHRQVIFFVVNRLLQFPGGSTGSQGDQAAATVNYVSGTAQLYTGSGGNLTPLASGYHLLGSGGYFMADAGTYRVDLSCQSESATYEEINVSVSYSANTDQVITSKNRVGPGLRIKTITSSDGITSTQKITAYQYVVPTETDRSSGHILSYPTYGVRQITRYTPGPNPATIPGGPPAGCQFILVAAGGAGNAQYDLECHYLPFSYENHAYLGSSHGRNVVYPLVTEVQLINGTPNGSTVSKFSFIGPIASSLLQYPFAPIVYHDYRNGLLIDKTTYTQAGQLISQEINNYKTETTANAFKQEGYVIQQFIFGNEFLSSNGSPLVSDFVSRSYFPLTEWVTLQSSIKRLFNPIDHSQKVQTSTDFVYGNPIHANVTEKHSTLSDGSIRIDYSRYPLDIVINGNGSASSITAMNNKHIYDVPVEQYSTIDRTGNPTQYVAGALSTFRLNGNFITKDKGYSLSFSLGNLSPITAYKQASVTGNNLVFDSHYEALDNFNQYDAANNLLELSDRDNTYAFIRNPVNGDVWAKAIHAGITDIAYTGFEHGAISSTAFTNWNYNTVGLYTTAGQSGSNGYSVSASSTISTARTLSASKSYRISFWAQAPGISVNNGSVNLRTGPARIVNGVSWTYFEGIASGITAIQLGGNGIIDELRLTPVDAKMVSYTYLIGVGMTSQCNENNQTTYWEYDEFNRLKFTRDQDGNILKKNEYQYQQTAN